jgi:hypothetical protein
VGARQRPELHGRRPAGDQPDHPARDPRGRRQLGVHLRLVPQPAGRGLRPLRRVVHRARGPDGARPRHRLARRELGLQRELDRDRARRLHERHPLPGRRVPRLRPAGGMARRQIPDHARPHARDRPLPGARPEPPRPVGRRRSPHGSRPYLELGPLHGLPARRRGGHAAGAGRQLHAVRRAVRPVRVAGRLRADGPVRRRLPGGGSARPLQPGEVPRLRAGHGPLRPADALAVRGGLRPRGRRRRDGLGPAHGHRRRGAPVRQVPVRRQLRSRGGLGVAAAGELRIDRPRDDRRRRLQAGRAVRPGASGGAGRDDDARRDLDRPFLDARERQRRRRRLPRVRRLQAALPGQGPDVLDHRARLQHRLHRLGARARHGVEPLAEGARVGADRGLPARADGARGDAGPQLGRARVDGPASMPAGASRRPPTSMQPPSPARACAEAGTSAFPAGSFRRRSGRSRAGSRAGARRPR